ncbi:dynein axonemal assembly factor 3-like [Chrysemys picta bellii]|uniref:dynein axonemal assembly factor 3-like n=1 Tax=Chrysemys picta bellii TaxID=8478 RepID=UPI0032B20FAF
MTTAAGSSFGTTCWWGFSPALDLQRECLESSMAHLCLSQDDLPELNILLVGSVDGRHVLRTMSQAHRWPQRRINFYLVENNLEALGRQLLFLSLALESPEKLGLQEKSEMFLELLGNSLIRRPTAAYLQEKSDLFVRYVTDPDFQQRHLGAVDLSALKVGPRHFPPRPPAFPCGGTDPCSALVPLLWLERAWHLGCWEIKCHHRASWERCSTMMGNALSPPTQKGELVPARGYWGDIGTGPYLPFGIESEEPSLLRTVNGVPAKSAQEISLYNVTALFHELAARVRYTPPPPTPEGASGAAPAQESPAPNPEPDLQDHKAACPGPVRIHFLPLGCTARLPCKSQYHQHFHLLYFSCSMVHTLTPELQLVSAPGATLITELTSFLPDVRKEQADAFLARVTAMAAGAGFAPCGTPEGQNRAWARFQRREEGPDDPLRPLLAPDVPPEDGRPTDVPPPVCPGPSSVGGGVHEV